MTVDPLTVAILVGSVLVIVLGGTAVESLVNGWIRLRSVLRVD
ncbi:MAG: hypothetical protein FWJ70_12675 [Micromonosporaceae bacterium]